MSMSVTSWGFNLDTGPLAKLVAIYIGECGQVDSNNNVRAEISLVEFCAWCNCEEDAARQAFRSLRNHEVYVRRQTSDVYVFELHLKRPYHSDMEKENTEIVFIYVLSTDAGVKIGITRDRENRLGQFKTAIPQAHKVELTAPGPGQIIRKMERECHSELKELRLRGEWFDCTAEKAVELVRKKLLAEGLVETELT